MKNIVILGILLSYSLVFAQKKADFYGRWVIYASEDKTYMMSEDNLEERTILLYVDFRDTVYQAQFSREPEKGKWNWNGKEIELNNKVFRVNYAPNLLELELLNEDKKGIMVFKARKLPENIQNIPAFFTDVTWTFSDFIVSKEAEESFLADTSLKKSFEEMKKSGKIQFKKDFNMTFTTDKTNISGRWWIEKDNFYQHSANGTLQKAKIYSLTKDEFIYGDERLRTKLKK